MAMSIKVKATPEELVKQIANQVIEQSQQRYEVKNFKAEVVLDDGGKATFKEIEFEVEIGEK